MYDAIVIGVSAGGFHALKTILTGLPASFSIPIVVVQHIHQNSDAFLVDHLNEHCGLNVKEAEDKEPICGNTVYFAPPDYHLLIDTNHSFSLSMDEKVNFSRPAIDLLFESAADTYGETLIGIILTGANSDGAIGLKTIKRRGGLAIVQNPKTAEASFMPQSALESTEVDLIIDLDRIAPLLIQLCEGRGYVSTKYRRTVGG
jgi:two-component system, chemotaxis family, protein-glutamate methylesterase/glutaminase